MKLQSASVGPFTYVCNVATEKSVPVKLTGVKQAAASNASLVTWVLSVTPLVWSAIDTINAKAKTTTTKAVINNFKLFLFPIYFIPPLIFIHTPLYF